MSLLTFADVQAAAARIAGHAHRTPVLRSRALDALAGCELHFKAEHLQRTGAFKFRGACNAVMALDDDALARGLVTQSSGNHGAALALAASLRGARATIVAPDNTPAVKLAAMRAYGGEVLLCEPTQTARDAATARLLADTGGTLVHPFNDPFVMAGQGTATLELLDEVPCLDTVLAPVSGGGLLSGTALAAHGIDARIRVLAAEPAGAPDAHASLAAGTRIANACVDTVCDGLRADVGVNTFPVLQQHVARVLLVDDADTRAAMTLLLTRMKQLVEPSGAITLAAVLAHRELFAGRRVGVILSGGNVDPTALPALLG